MTILVIFSGSQVNLGLILGISEAVVLFLLGLSWFFNSKNLVSLFSSQSFLLVLISFLL